MPNLIEPDITGFKSYNSSQYPLQVIDSALLLKLNKLLSDNSTQMLVDDDVSALQEYRQNKYNLDVVFSALLLKFYNLFESNSNGNNGNGDNSNSNNYWLDPIIGIDPDNPQEGDRYIDSSDLGSIKVFNGQDIPILDGSSFYNLSSQERGGIYHLKNGLLSRSIPSFNNDSRVPTPCDNNYSLGTEWNYQGSIYKAYQRVNIDNGSETIGSSANAGNLVAINHTIEAWQSFTPTISGGLTTFRLGGFFNGQELVTSIFRIYRGEGITGEKIYEELAAYTDGFAPELQLSCVIGLEAGQKYTWSLQKQNASDPNYVIRQAESDYIANETTNRGNNDYYVAVVIGAFEGLIWKKFTFIESYQSAAIDYQNGLNLFFAKENNYFYKVSAWAICIADQNGWVVGEEIELNEGITIAETTSGFFIKIAGNGAMMVRKNGNQNEIPLQDNSWRIFIKGIRWAT